MLSTYYFSKPEKQISKETIFSYLPPNQLDNIIQIVKLVLGNDAKNYTFVDVSYNSGSTALGLVDLGYQVISLDQGTLEYKNNVKGEPIEVVQEVNVDSNHILFLDLITRRKVPKINYSSLPVVVVISKDDTFDLPLPLEKYTTYEYNLSSKDFFEDMATIDIMYKNDLKLLSKDSNFKLYVLVPNNIPQVMLNQDLYESTSDFETRIVLSKHIMDRFPNCTSDVITMLACAMLQKLRTGQIYCHDLEKVMQYLFSDKVDTLFTDYDSILKSVSVQKQSLLQQDVVQEDVTEEIIVPKPIFTSKDIMLDEGIRIVPREEEAQWVLQQINALAPKYTLVEGISDEGVISKTLMSSKQLGKVNLHEKPAYKEYQYFIFSTNNNFIDQLQPNVKVFKTKFNPSVLPNTANKKVLFLNPSVLNTGDEIKEVTVNGKTIEEFSKELFKLPNTIAPHFIVIKSYGGAPLVQGGKVVSQGDQYLTILQR
jgi:hypothetical protein